MDQWKACLGKNKNDICKNVSATYRDLRHGASLFIKDQYTGRQQQPRAEEQTVICMKIKTQENPSLQSIHSLLCELLCLPSGVGKQWLKVYCHILRIRRMLTSRKLRHTSLDVFAVPLFSAIPYHFHIIPRSGRPSRSNTNPCRRLIKRSSDHRMRSLTKHWTLLSVMVATWNVLRMNYLRYEHVDTYVHHSA